jgi:hypothetical protein
MIKKKMVWEKWIDPLNKNIDEVEYPGHSSVDENDGVEMFSSDMDFEKKLDAWAEQDEEEDDRKRMSFNPSRIASTPHGFVSMTEHSFASKHFDFWTMHYNQDITPKIVEIIEKCQGVETLNTLTRYRVRIGFNRPLIQSGAFNLNEIRKQIENAVINSESKKTTEEFLKNNKIK